MSPRLESHDGQLLSSQKLMRHVYSIPGMSQPCGEDLDTKLRRLEDKLTSFDPAQEYATIQSDLEAKYQLAADYYAKLDCIRDNLINEKCLHAEKEAQHKKHLREQLDLVVNTLRCDFTSHVEECYALFDTLFVLRTNKYTQQELHSLEEKVQRCLSNVEVVYSEEFRKIQQIYDLLDDEGLRLNQFLDVKST